MTYPAITWSFQEQACSNYAMQADHRNRGQNDPDGFWGEAWNISQQIFLLGLQRIIPRYTPQQICDELDEVDRIELLWTLKYISGREELKSLRPLYAAMLLYTTEGLTEEEAIARTASASDDEITHPEGLLLHYLRSLLPANHPHNLPTRAP